MKTKKDKSAQRIGVQIRELRKAKGLTLQDLAKAVDRSLGYVSQVERGVSVLPIPVLQEISAVLGVGITWFFEAQGSHEENEQGRIVRKSQRKRLDFLGVGIQEELLSPSLAGKMLMLLTRFEPLARTDPQQRKREGEELAYIQSGRLNVQISGTEYQLNVGDSFRLQADEVFIAHNPSRENVTEVVWVISPPIY